MSEEAEQPTVYAVRLYERAYRDIDLAFSDYLDATGNEARAMALRTGLRDMAVSLNVNPERHPVAEHESQMFGFTVRRTLHRLTKGSTVAHHLIYFAEKEGPDGPVVFVVHVRHASRAPLTEDEARY